MRGDRLAVYRLYHFGVIRVPSSAAAKLGTPGQCGLRPDSDGNINILPFKRRSNMKGTFISESGSLLIPAAYLECASIKEFAYLEEEKTGGYRLFAAPSIEGDEHPNSAECAAATGRWLDYYFSGNELSFQSVCAMRCQLILAEENERFNHYGMRVEQRIVLDHLSKLMYRKQARG